MKVATTLHKSGQYRSITSESKLANIYLILCYFLKEAPGGIVVEFGSYGGGSADFMAYIVDKVVPGTKVFVLDTFAGMPKTDPDRDQHKEGDFSDRSLEDVQTVIDSIGIKNIELVPGLFEDTARNLMPGVGKVSFTHIDLISTLLALRLTTPSNRSWFVMVFMCWMTQHLVLVLVLLNLSKII